MSVLISIAEAVKDDLNAASFSQEFTAARKYRPVRPVEELQALTVTVAGREIERERATRKKTNHDYGVDIAIQKKLDPERAEAEADELMTFAEELADHVAGLLFESIDAARCRTVEVVAAYDAEHWDELNTFTSLLRLQFSVLR